MPRKTYLNDLAAALEIPQHGNNISNVRPGSDDGEFVFSFKIDSKNSLADISVLIPDLSEYPTGHECHIFATEDAPASIARAVETLPNYSGVPLATLLPLLSRNLTERTRTGGQDDPLEIDSDGDAYMTDSAMFDGTEDEEFDDEDADNEDWTFNDGLEDETRDRTFRRVDDLRKPSTLSSQFDYVSRGREDLRAVKNAGFKVGVIGNLQTDASTYVSISCRIAKLGISEEAMTAWSIKPEEYLILLISYKTGYKPLDFLLSMDPFVARQHFDMRIGLSDSYKAVSQAEARSAFKISADDARPSNGQEAIHAEGVGFRPSFVSRPLEQLLNGRFLAILKNRLDWDTTWLEAELYNNENQASDQNQLDMAMALEEYPSHTTLPGLVTCDEILKRRNYNYTPGAGKLYHPLDPKQLSLPLIAMQFLLRHFVSAPSFCLVCHCKLKNQLEAIKPYVCDNTLCLYQYMSLGFGPSIEHELMTQPYVVDLLISFCYASVRAASLHTLPVGLGLMVPHPDLPLNNWKSTITPPREHPMALPPLANINPNMFDVSNLPKSEPLNSSQPKGKVYEARLNQSNLELLHDRDRYQKCPVKKGEWVVINMMKGPTWHCRVVETILYPTVLLAEPVQYPDVANLDDQLPRPCVWEPIEFHVYNQNLDDLHPMKRYESLQLLLDLMPSVTDMCKYLQKKRGASLATWSERMCPATLSLLRWIVASNRSCIMQVDRCETEKIPTENTSGEQRVQGVPDWLQFRFAMGAPDKEQRFIDAIKSSKPKENFPTLFAWHGSNLPNWHNIIRESLNFNKTVHGRAYGHGVYFAKDFNTSCSYAAYNVNSGTKYPGAWPNSVLQISAVLALAEIVNAPDHFVNQFPYYVVAQLDWIQTRYLFVRSASNIKTLDTAPTTILEQDPQRTPSGSQQIPIVLPITAIPKSRRPAAKLEIVTESPKKKARLTFSALQKFGIKVKGETTRNVADDCESIETDNEDLTILLEPSPVQTLPTQSGNKKPSSVPTARNASTTAFVPSIIKGLLTMPVPSYATSSATRRLQRDFRNLLTTQESHMASGTLADLGWYLDPEHVSRTDNLYQWIFELHSFPKELPLATDMEARKIQSIVFEMRFHASYPMTPPFLRVIRPRFLPFQQGGGGHVTLGGSICMDLLTNSGWSAANSIESVLLQIRMAIMSTDPRPARLENVKSGRNGTDYGVAEAVEAFKRACRMHGWVVPKELDEVMAGEGVKAK